MEYDSPDYRAAGAAYWREEAERDRDEGVPLAKVFPAGGPILPGHPDYQFPPRHRCQQCRMDWEGEPTRNSCLIGRGAECPSLACNNTSCKPA